MGQITNLVTKVSETEIDIKTTNVFSKTISLKTILIQRQRVIEQITALDQDYLNRKKALTDQLPRMDDVIAQAQQLGVVEEVANSDPIIDNP